MSGTRRIDPEATNADHAKGTDATRRVEPSSGSGTRRVAPTQARPGMVTTTGPASPLGTLLPGAPLLKEYTVQQTICPHETQRPGIYLCAGPTGKVIIKVAAVNHPPKPELWDRLCGLKHPNLVQTLATTEYEGRYYEVQEYCSGGSLCVWGGLDGAVQPTHSAMDHGGPGSTGLCCAGVLAQGGSCPPRHQA